MAQTSSDFPQTEEVEHPPAHLRHDRDEKASLLHFVLRIPRHWLLCIVIGGVALSLNLYRLGSPSLWFDEVLSVERARQPLSVLWRIVSSTQQNMALYYVLLHFWLGFTTLLGLHTTEFVVRFPSAIFAALGSMLVFLLGRRLLGMIGGMVGASLYVFNSLQLVYAQEARAYSLQLLLICIAWYALFAALSPSGTFLSLPAAAREKRRFLGTPQTPAGAVPLHPKEVRWWAAAREKRRFLGTLQTPAGAVPLHSREVRWWAYACYSAAMILAVYTQLFSLVMLFAQVLAVGGLVMLPSVWRDTIRRQLLALMVSLLSITLLVIPVLFAARHSAKTAWLPIPHLLDVYTLFLTVSGNSTAYLLGIAACCVLGVCVVTLAHRSLGKRRAVLMPSSSPKDIGGSKGSLWPVAFALVCWLVVPLVVSYVVSQGSTRLFSSRYLVTIMPPLFLLVGLGIAVLRWRVVQVVLAVSLVLVALHHVPQYYDTAQVESWRVPALWLEQHYQAGDGLVCYDNAEGCQISMEYYFRAYPTAAHFTADSPGAFPWASYDITNRLGNFGAAVDPAALAAYGAKHTRLFFIVGRVPNNADAAQANAARQWLDTHYHFVTQSVTSTVTVRLYTTDAGGNAPAL